MKKISIILAFVLFIQTIAFAAEADTVFDDLESGLYLVEDLISECQARGLDVGYEIIDYETIKDFIKFGREDIAMGDTERAEYVASSINSMYDDVYNTLKAYLSAEKKPKAVVRNSSTDVISVNNGNFVNQNGKSIIYNGYGHGDMAKNDIERMQNFGADLVAIEIGPDAVIGLQGEIDGWDIYKNGDVVSEVSVYDGGYNSSMHSLKISNESESSKGYTAVSRYISVKPETKYNLSFYCRTLNASGNFYILGGWDGERKTISDGTNGWTKYETTYTTKSGETSVELLMVSEGISKAIYLDDIVVTEEGSEENIIYNGDFEKSSGMTSEHFRADISTIWDKAARPIIDAEKNNIKIMLLISPHYFNKAILEEFPDMAEVDSGYGYDMYSDLVREYFNLYIKAIIDTVGEMPALHSICLANEPKGDTRSFDSSKAFHQYLTGKYDSIQELNDAYGNTEYQNFSEIPMPASDTMDAEYYDWVCFNDEYYAGFYRFLAECVKKYSNIPVHLKTMTLWGDVKSSLNYGTDPELFAEFTDYNGNDTWGYYNTVNGDWMLKKAMWYDFLKSIDNKPIINSEDHVTKDGDENYDENHGIQIGTDVWQGAIHGMDASAIWLWERTDNHSSDVYGNIRYRPDAVSNVGKRSLDLNRCAEQVTTLQNAKSKVSILYSKTARAYSTRIMDNTFTAYKGAIFAAGNPSFITERQLTENVSPKDVLIIPGITNICEEAREAIKSYRENGGKVLALGWNCLSANEYNKGYKDYIFFDKTLISYDEYTISTEIKKLCPDLVKLKDEAGTDLTDVDIVTGKYDGEDIMNVCNLIWGESKEMVIDKPMTDVITGERYRNTVLLEPFKPVLLFNTYKDMDFTVINNNGTVTVTVNNDTDNRYDMELYIKIKQDDRYLNAAYIKETVGRGQVKNYKYSGIDDDCQIEVTSLYNNGIQSFYGLYE